MIVNYRYWNKVRNCGDAVMAYLIQDVLGATPVRVGADVPHLLGVGSIYFMATPTSYMWGSGILRPEQGLRDVPTENIRAARGKKSLAFLQQERPELADVPLGDPGILTSYLLDDAAFQSLPRRYRVAVVPHYRSAAKPEYLAMAEDPDVCLVDMRDATLRPLELIQQADCVVSQSLHGLVFASALGKPNVWLSDVDEPHWNFKFEDWFSTVDNPQARSLPLGTPLAELEAAAEARDVAVDADALLDAFPWDEVSAPDVEPVVDFRSARKLETVVVRHDWVSDDGPRRTQELVDSREANRITRDVRQVLASLFASWSELPYVLIAPHGMQLDDELLDLLPRLMDRHTGPEAMFLMPSSATELLDPSERKALITMSGFRASREALLTGGALVMRPSVLFGFNRKIFNLFY